MMSLYQVNTVKYSGYIHITTTAGLLTLQQSFPCFGKYIYFVLCIHKITEVLLNAFIPFSVYVCHF